MYIQFLASSNVYWIEDGYITKAVFLCLGSGLKLPKTYVKKKMAPHKILSQEELDDFLLKTL